MLPLTFANPADYDLIAPEGAKISIIGLKDFAPGKVREATRQTNVPHLNGSHALGMGHS
jgi:hypothetical protein